MNKKIKLNFIYLNKVAFSAKIHEVVDEMDGNATFPTLATQVTALKSALEALDVKEAERYAAEVLLDQRRTERDAQRLVVTELAVALAAGVTNVAAGNEAILVQSGFDLTGTPQPSAPLPPPADFRAGMGAQTGTIALRWNKVRNAKSYVVEMSISATGPWAQVALPTKASCMVTGLTSGTHYYFRVRANGTDGLSPWSDLAEKMAP